MESVEQGGQVGPPKRGLGEAAQGVFVAVRAFFTPDRAVAVSALAIVPMMLGVWAYVPLLSHSQFDISFSVTDLLNAASALVDKLENVQALVEQIREALETLISLVEGLGSLLGGRG